MCAENAIKYAQNALQYNLSHVHNWLKELGCVGIKPFLGSCPCLATLPRQSEISEKNWSTQTKSFLYLKKINENIKTKKKRSWEPFRSCHSSQSSPFSQKLDWIDSAFYQANFFSLIF